MKRFSEDSTVQPTTLRGVMMEDLLLRHTSTTSYSHGCINPVKQRKSVDTSKMLFMPHGRTVGVFYCDKINVTLHSGDCGTGSEQLHFWGRTRIWCAGVTVIWVEEGSGSIVVFG
jgi:hypothetical protein